MNASADPKMRENPDNGKEVVYYVSALTNICGGTPIMKRN